MSVLVDTSVWIGYFSKGEYIQLERLIKEDLVVTNDLILAELLPFMHKAGAFKAIHALEAKKNCRFTGRPSLKCKN